MNNTIRIEIEDDQKYLTLFADEEWTIEYAKRIIDEAKIEVEKRNYKKVLFDVTKWDKPKNELIRFLSAEYLAEVLPPPIKVAAYAKKEIINRFAELVAFNRSAWFKVFHIKKEAIAWLVI